MYVCVAGAGRKAGGFVAAQCKLEPQGGGRAYSERKSQQAGVGKAERESSRVGWGGRKQIQVLGK